MHNQLNFLEGEIFVSHPIYIQYLVSNMGRIYSTLGRGKFIYGRLNKGREGYYQISVAPRDGGRNDVLVHRMVTETFIGPRPLGYQINHKDGDTTNNRLENLEYCSPRENMRHFFAMKKRKKQTVQLFPL